MALVGGISAMLQTTRQLCQQRYLHVTAVVSRTQAGRHRATRRQNKPLTYEMANPPHYIAHRKAWNSWNTSNVLGGNRPGDTAVEDIFVRRFMNGTWHGVFVSDIIIKRQHNIIRIAGLVQRVLPQRKMYFLIGYSEELLSYWLQCPVKLELQTVPSRLSVIYKYV